MPITRSAIKKLRRDRKKEKENQKLKEKVKQAFKKAQRENKSESVKNAVSLIDKATKTHLFHKNKASRLKSMLAKQVKSTGSPRITTGKKTRRSKQKKPSSSVQKASL